MFQTSEVNRRIVLAGGREKCDYVVEELGFQIRKSPPATKSRQQDPLPLRHRTK